MFLSAHQVLRDLQGILTITVHHLTSHCILQIREKGDYGPEAPNGIEPELFASKFEVLTPIVMCVTWAAEPNLRS